MFLNNKKQTNNFEDNQPQTKNKKWGLSWKQKAVGIIFILALGFFAISTVLTWKTNSSHYVEYNTVKSSINNSQDCYEKASVCDVAKESDLISQEIAEIEESKKNLETAKARYQSEISKIDEALN